MNSLYQNAAIVIDVFRAFTTAALVLDRSPASYLLTYQCAVLQQQIPHLDDPLLIGKPERGSSLSYHIPNSPTRTEQVPIKGRSVLHRTEAGARGVLSAPFDLILAASFVNAPATVAYLQQVRVEQVTLFPMGHEASSPSLEDDLCADYIEARLQGAPFDLAPHIEQLRQGAGRYFFGSDQEQYPESDFWLCLSVGLFPFAIRAIRREGYATLERACPRNKTQEPLLGDRLEGLVSPAPATSIERALPCSTLATPTG